MVTAVLPALDRARQGRAIDATADGPRRDTSRGTATEVAHAIAEGGGRERTVIEPKHGDWSRRSRRRWTRGADRGLGPWRARSPRRRVRSPRALARAHRRP